MTLRYPGLATGAVAYRVYRNGELLTQTSDTTMTDRGRPQGTWKYEVSALDWQGEETPRVPVGVFERRPLPRSMPPTRGLTSSNPTLHSQDYGGLARRRSVEQNPLRIGGKQFERGLGTHANGQTQFTLNNRYQRFEAMVGVDDEKQGAGSVVFQVVLDGRKVFDSGVMRGKEPAKKVSAVTGRGGGVAAGGHRCRRRNHLRSCRLGRRPLDRQPLNIIVNQQRAHTMKRDMQGRRTALVVLAGSGIMLTALSVGSAPAADAVDLRGYGRVQASITPGRSEFTCESDAKADILLGKLLADMFWDAGQDHVAKTVKIGGRDVVVHAWQPYGAVIAGRLKNRVLVWAARTSRPR